MDLLQQLRSKRDELITQIDGLTSADDFDPADKDFTEARSQAEALDSKIKAITELQASRAAANEVDALAIRATKQVEQRKASEVDGLTPGQIFTRSKAYADYREAPRGTSGHVMVPTDMFMQRAPILTTTFPGVLQSERIAEAAPPRQQNPLLAVMNRIPVMSNSVEWVFYPAAAPLAGNVPEGQAKPEAVVAPELRTVSLQIVAHHLTVSRSVSEDGTAMMAYIDAALRRGVTDKVEANAAAAIVADTEIPVTDNDGTLLEGIRRAIANVQDAGYVPTNVLLNPQDYAELDIEVLGKTLLGPQIGSQFWGVSPVPVGAIPQGTAYVGDVSTALVLLTRSEVSLYQTDSHASNFTSNLITLLAEVRAQSIVHRPEAITKVTAAAPLAVTGGGSKAKAV